MKKPLYILVFLLVALVGCRSPKTVTNDTRLKEQRNIQNDVSLLSTSDIDQLVARSLLAFYNESLNISINSKVYDTDKPADPDTGKSPLKEETNITINKETDGATAENETTRTTTEAASQLSDNSLDKSKVKSSEQTETKTGFTSLQKTLMIVGGLALIGSLAYFLIFKLKL